MDKINFNKAMKNIRNLKLSKEERSLMLHKILKTKIQSPYFNSLSMFSHTKKSAILFISIGLILVSSGGGTIVLASESAVPGDVLYNVKIKINEPALDFINTSAEEKAKWESEKISRRLREAEMLAINGDIDTEKSKIIEEKIQEHQKEFDRIVNDISTTTESHIRENVEIEYGAKIKAHSRILDKIKDGASEEVKNNMGQIQNSILLKVEKNQKKVGERIRETREKREAERNQNNQNEDDWERNFNNQIEDTEKSAEETAKNIEREKDILDIQDTIRKDILEESDKIIKETRDKIRSAKNTIKIKDSDKEKIISDIENSIREISETNTTISEIKKIRRNK